MKENGIRVRGTVKEHKAGKVEILTQENGKQTPKTVTASLNGLMVRSTLANSRRTNDMVMER